MSDIEVSEIKILEVNADRYTGCPRLSSSISHDGWAAISCVLASKSCFRYVQVVEQEAARSSDAEQDLCCSAAC